MEAEVAAGLNLKNFRIKKFVEERAGNLHLPAGSDPPPFGFILNRDSSAPPGGDQGRAARHVISYPWSLMNPSILLMRSAKCNNSGNLWKGAGILVGSNPNSVLS